MALSRQAAMKGIPMRSVLVSGLALLVRTGCGESVSPTVPVQGPSVPVLTFPPNGAMIEQNDPRGGCPFNPSVGFGLYVPYDWQDSTSVAGISHYEVLVLHRGSSLPAVDTA